MSRLGTTSTVQVERQAATKFSGKTQSLYVATFKELTSRRNQEKLPSCTSFICSIDYLKRFEEVPYRHIKVCRSALTKVGVVNVPRSVKGLS